MLMQFASENQNVLDSYIYFEEHTYIYIYIYM